MRRIRLTNGERHKLVPRMHLTLLSLSTRQIFYSNIASWCCRVIKGVKFLVAFTLIVKFRKDGTNLEAHLAA
jgi:hypothetical protein